MKIFSLKITLSIISTIVALLMINLIASAHQIFLPIVVQGEDVVYVPTTSTSIPTNTGNSDSSSDNPNTVITTIPPPDTDRQPPSSPTPTATFLPGVPTYTPYPTFTPRPTSTPGPSPTNLQIGPGTPVPDGWAPPPPFGP